MGHAHLEHDGGLATDLHLEATDRLTQALVEAEVRMRRRVELLAEVLFETDADGRLVFLNGAWRCALGHEPDACLGQPLEDFVVKEDWETVAGALRAERVSAPELRPVVRVRRADGGESWMELSVARIPSGGTVGALHDVTDRRRAQDELAKLSLVASSTDNLVVITDRSGYTEWVNPAFTKKTGYTIEDLRGRTPGSVLQGPETDPDTVRQIGRWLREGRSFEAELLNYTREQEPYWVQVQVTPIRDEHGELERFVAIQSDFTEWRRTQAELEAARERAEAANTAKTLFLATISHEMRTPLNAILGSTDLALDGETDPVVLRDHLLRIGTSAEKLLHLISDVLDLSNIEAGQIDIERVPVRLEACVREALAPIADRARANGLDFSLTWDETLPAWIEGDPARLRQIVTNLVENAVKFTDEGFVRVQAVCCTTAPTGGPALELRVIDSGLGIAEQDQSLVFERFVQGDSSTTRRKGGAGLGLSIVRSLVDALGGAVSVHSRSGAGAEFRVVLPLRAVDEPVSGDLHRANGPRATPLPSVPHDTRVLVAEDNDINYAVLQAYLVRAGYAVQRARNGLEAVVAAPDVDLILMDLEMPDMDGVTATRTIRRAEQARGASAVPVLALTAHALQEYRDQAIAAGCDGYLSKPVRMQSLLEAVAAALG
jgi:two-component system sensor histidine kinase/response regulator